MAWYNDNWSHRKKLTIDNTKIGSTLSNFPVCVLLDNSNFDFSSAKSDGTDVLFTSSDGTTLLKFERVYHDDTNEKAEYHVKISSVSDSADTEFYMYYGNAGATDAQDASNVWDSNYAVVYHCNEDPTGAIADSTSPSEDATSFGSMTSGDLIDQLPGKGLDLDGTDDGFNPSMANNYTSGFTSEIMFRYDGVSTDLGELISKRSYYATSNTDFPLALYVDGSEVLTSLIDSGGDFAIDDTLQDSGSLTSGDTYYACQVYKDSDYHRLFKDATIVDQNNSISFTIASNSRDWTVGRASHEQAGQSGYTNLDGVVSEVRISIIARSDDWIKATSYTLNDELLTFGSEENLTLTVSQEETIDLSDTISTGLISTSVEENLNITDEIDVNLSLEKVSLEDTIDLSDTITASITQQADYGTRILSYNPLIFVTDTSPIQIVKVDISTPSSPSWEVYTVSGVSNANNVAYNSTEGYLYISADSGKVIKADINDLNSQSIIDVSDTDNLMTIDILDDFYLTYVGTNNSIGELYLIDTRDVTKIDTDFHYLERKTEKIDTQFNFLSTGTAKIDTKFEYLNTESTFIETNFNFVTQSNLNTLSPISRSDFKVYVDNVQLSNSDVDLGSIIITHEENEQSRLTVKLNRRHDAINTDLDNNTRQISNHNAIKVTIDGVTEFDGNVSNLNCIFSNNDEAIQVTALMEQPTERYNNITLSLPSVNEDLNLYHVIMNNLNIYNPYVDPTDEDDPPIYKGIRVSLGTKVIQNISRWRYLGNVSTLADSVQEGTFNAKQNWSYFWTAIAKNFITGDQWGNLRYVGTTPASLTSDTFNITGMSYKYQRQFEDSETDLGNYEVGSAPFKDISVRNGKKITKQKWEDKDDGLYSVKEAGYDFVQYAKDVADLEYAKMTNINGNILPKTSADITLTLDGYYYHNINLLTRINIDNTTESNIYNNNNGFPVSVKSIQISSDTMKVILSTDNEKSNIELADIDGSYPDEDSDEYNFAENSSRIHRKFNPNTLTYIV